jgi:hypothetical protein
MIGNTRGRKEVLVKLKFFGLKDTHLFRGYLFQIYKYPFFCILAFRINNELSKIE